MFQQQSDRIEGEFGICRNLSSGNFHIFVQKVLNSLSLHRVKLFGSLETEKLTQHKKKERCCSIILTEEEINSINGDF